ncbi:hypothetical protein PE143B_0124935 [Pseudomonas extremaustralis 14-3 substr. 14-3b]|nr:hypothetical protein PE143B_0124935 [Pseudomonas extremaustralis 14-3 substr. 14-3b]
MLLRCAFFINRLGLDVCRGPVVQFLPIEPDATPADWELADEGSDGLVEDCPAHAQITRSLFGSNEARDQLLSAHTFLLPPMLGSVLMMFMVKIYSACDGRMFSG